MVLRINAALVFLSLCLGNVLVEFIGPDAATILTSTHANVPNTVPHSQMVIDLVLLLFPVVTTMLIMLHTVKGSKLAFNFLPAIGVSLLGTLLAVPLMSAGLTGSITHLGLWHTLESLQTAILGASTLVSLGLLWMMRPKSHIDEVKHH
jgi:hypothetical protein